MSEVGSRIQLNLPMDQIAAFCRRWKITEFALFGSVLREDFRPDSDVDVLITFAPNSAQTLSDLIEMQEDIEAIFRRKVDLIDRRAIEHSRNYIRRKAILGSAQTIYAP
jgi:uncharacterized protein